MAPSLGIELRPIDLRDADQLERAVATFARAENGRLVVAPSATVSIGRDPIIGLAAWHKLPAVYGARAAVAAGGMAFCGSDERELYKGAAGYVDRILKGGKAGELPVQAPNKLELVINLKTAKALGLNMPPSLQGLRQSRPWHPDAAASEGALIPSVAPRRMGGADPGARWTRTGACSTQERMPGTAAKAAANLQGAVNAAGCTATTADMWVTRQGCAFLESLSCDR